MGLVLIVFFANSFHSDQSELFPGVSHKTPLIICQLLIGHVKDSNNIKNKLCNISRGSSATGAISWIVEIRRLRMSVKEVNRVEY